MSVADEMGRSGLLQYCACSLVQCFTFKLSKGSSRYQLTTRAQEQFDMRKGISAENAAYKPRGRVFKSLTHTHTTHVGRIFCGLTMEFVCLMKSCWLPYICVHSRNRCEMVHTLSNRQKPKKFESHL
jgi:hypothetical protein